MEEGDHQLTKKEKRVLAREARKEDQERKQMFSKLKKLLFTIIPLFLIVWVGYKAFNFFRNSQQAVLSQNVEVLDSDWVKGKSEAKVTLVEYGDFQCPACVNYEPLVQRLLGEFPEDLKLVYRHFPLTTIHRNAYASSRASEAAGKQGKFWEMHDLLYARQKDWENSSTATQLFFQYAKEIGLDEEKFKSDFESKEVEEKINKDLASGTSFGVNATPTFILNGQKVQPRSYEEFKKLVEDQIKGYTLE